MFDDQPVSTPQKPPTNLPLDPPEDMFADTADVPSPQKETMGVPEESPSALEAGILRPKQAGVLPRPALETPQAVPASPPKTERMITPPPMMGEREYTPTVSYLPERAGVGKTLLIIALIILGAGVIGGGAWYVYMRMQGVNPLTQTVVPDTTETELVPPVLTEPVEPVTEAPVEPQAQTGDSSVLFGETIDSDSDGLDDIREGELGTSAVNWDTDGDTLSDYDEVMVWKTDPRAVDSDNDAFADNVEINNGYNPAGPGRMFDPRVSSDTTGSASTTF